MRDDPFYDDDMIRRALLGNVSRCFLFLKSIINLWFKYFYSAVCCFTLFVVPAQDRAGRESCASLICVVFYMLCFRLIFVIFRAYRYKNISIMFRASPIRRFERFERSLTRGRLPAWRASMGTALHHETQDQSHLMGPGTHCGPAELDKSTTQE